MWISLTSYVIVSTCFLDILVLFPRGMSKSGIFPNGKTHHKLDQQLRSMEELDVVTRLIPGMGSSETCVSYLHVSLCWQ